MFQQVVRSAGIIMENGRIIEFITAHQPTPSPPHESRLYTAWGNGGEGPRPPPFPQSPQVMPVGLTMYTYNL